MTAIPSDVESTRRIVQEGSHPSRKRPVIAKAIKGCSEFGPSQPVDGHTTESGDPTNALDPPLVASGLVPANGQQHRGQAREPVVAHRCSQLSAPLEAVLVLGVEVLHLDHHDRVVESKEYVWLHPSSAIVWVGLEAGPEVPRWRSRRLLGPGARQPRARLTRRQDRPGELVVHVRQPPQNRRGECVFGAIQLGPRRRAELGARERTAELVVEARLQHRTNLPFRYALHLMSRYGDTAVRAAKLASAGRSPREAWESASCAVFGAGTPSQRKGCPKTAFLALCDSGRVVGVGPSDEARAGGNRDDTLAALGLLDGDPELEAPSATQLWRAVRRGRPAKQHNGQMDVVLGLAQAGLLRGPR
jgi:hypothetical protein